MIKQEILNEAKMTYQSLKEEQEEVNRIKDRITELEKDEKVKEYFELACKLDNHNDLTSKELYLESFSNIDKEELDKIYYKNGYYIQTDDGYKETKYSEIADVIAYKNLVNDEVKWIINSKSEVKKFENNNYIIKFPVMYDKLGLLVIELVCYYYELILTSNSIETSEVMEKLNEKVKELTK